MKRGAMTILACGMIFLFSCDDNGGRIGPSRRADKILCSANGINEGYFQYANYFGPITQSGVRMNFREAGVPTYSKSNGLGDFIVVPVPSTEQRITCSGVTGPNEIMTVRGSRGNWELIGRFVTLEAAISQPIIDGSGGASARFRYITWTPPKKEYAIAFGDGPIVAHAHVPPESYSFNGVNLTLAEYTALTTPTQSAPLSGISSDKGWSLLVQDGQIGQGGSPREITNFMAVNLSDPNEYLRYSAPFYCSAIFKTAAAVDLSGFTFGGKIKSNASPEGIDVQLKVIGSNADKQTHVVRTECFLPVDQRFCSRESVKVYDRWTPFADPNIWDERQYVVKLKDNWIDYHWDPNIPIDPNDYYGIYPQFFDFSSRLDTSVDNFDEICIPERIMEVKILPVFEEGDYLEVYINKNDLTLISEMLDHLLSNNVNYDLNEDGIVNLKDLYIMSEL